MNYKFIFVALLSLFLTTTKSTVYAGSSDSEEFEPTEMIMHHIADANEFHVAGDVSIPLPVIVYSPQNGLDIFLSSKLDHGKTAYNGYVIDHGVVAKIADENFPLGLVENVHVHHGKATYNGVDYELADKYTLLNDKRVFFDFSITKNVFTLFLAIFILLFVFLGMSKFYQKGNLVPKGFYSALEPIVIFVRDDIAKTNIGEEKYKKFLPFLLTVFFFIWIINLIGLVPFFPGSANLTGNIALTFVLSVITLIITNVNGSKYYWGHIFNPPVPGPLKILMVPIELIGIFTKPFALMIRLFANITAGHILILSLLSLIFIFKSFVMPFVSVPFVIFMTFLELLVALLQAYIFTLLSALFIGLAVEDHH